MRHGSSADDHVERDAVDMIAQHQNCAQVHASHEDQRGQKVAAKLRIGHPRRALLENL